MSWELPVEAEAGGRVYRLNTDYRDILEIIGVLNGGGDAYCRSYTAMCLFYDGLLEQGDDLLISSDDYSAAFGYLCDFISCGTSRGTHSAVKLIDWTQDEPLISAEINKSLHCEIRLLPYLHWFTFVGYFMAIGEGLLSAVVGIRDKRARGRKLEKWEQDFYRRHKSMIDFTAEYTPDERAEKARLLALLDGGSG